MSQEEFHCPSCDAVVTLRDVKMPEHVALCPKCRQVFELTELVRCNPDDLLLEKEPPKSLKMTQTPEGLVIKSKRNIPIIIFFTIFGAISSFVVVSGVYTYAFTQDAMLMLLPFILVDLAICTLILYFIFGKQTVTLKPGQAEVFLGINNLGYKRTIRLHPDSQIDVKPSNWSKKNGQVIYQIEITHGNDDVVRFGKWLDNQEALEYLAALLRSMR